MKKSILVLSLLFFTSLAQSQTNWDQLGNNLYSYLSNGNSRNIDLSSDGYTIIIGQKVSSPATLEFKVFNWTGTNWVQKGQTLAKAGNNSPAAKISNDGNVIVIGGMGGLANTQVFEWNGVDWVQKGTDIIVGVDAAQERFGENVSMNFDGTVIAISSSNKNSVENTAGGVRVYEWNGIDWQLKGNILLGQMYHQRFGSQLELSQSGNLLAVQSNPWYGCATGFGWVTIYEYIDNVGWEVKGNPIYSNQEENAFGCALSFSGNGNDLAIGAFSHDLGTYPNSGQGNAEVYFWNGIQWALKGQVLLGQQTSEYFGGALQLSQDGNKLAVVSEGFDLDVNSNYNGKISFFNYVGTQWVNESNLTIYGANDSEMKTIALNDDFTIVMYNAMSADYVKVFELVTSSVNENTPKDIKMAIFPNPSNSIINIEMTQVDISKGIKVFDVSGKLITNYSINESGDLVSLNIENLEIGTYFITVFNLQTKKFQQVKFVKI